MRRVLTPKWLAWHVLAVVLAVACLRLGLWQWHRARATGSMQSMGYALQWPVFAVFGLFFWWRTVHDAVRPPATAAPRPPAKRRPISAPPRPPVTDDEDPELAAYNRYLAELNERAEGR